MFKNIEYEELIKKLNEEETVREEELIKVKKVNGIYNY